MIQTPVPDGFKSVRTLMGVGGRDGVLVQGGGSGDLAVLTFVPTERGSAKEQLIWQAFENATQLDHPNIGPPTALTRVEGGLLLTSPWLDGPSVRMIIDARRGDRRALDLKTLLKIARPVCAALHYGHSEALDVDGDPLHIPHGWIRPETVIVSSAGKVIVADYWIGWVIARLGRRIPTTYTSPQIARGEPPSAQGDIFALGALLFELATLEPLIPETSSGDLHRALSAGAYRRRFDLLGPRSPGLQAVIRRCLAPAGAHRYSDVRALDQDLARLSRGEEPLALVGERPSALEESLTGEGPETLAPQAQRPAPPEAEVDPDLVATQRIEDPTAAPIPPEAAAPLPPEAAAPIPPEAAAPIPPEAAAPLPPEAAAPILAEAAASPAEAPSPTPAAAPAAAAEETPHTLAETAPLSEASAPPAPVAPPAATVAPATPALTATLTPPAYDARATEEMPPGAAAAAAAAANGWDSPSEAGEEVTEWFKGSEAAAEVVADFNSPSPFEQARGWERPLRDGEDAALEPELEEAVRPPRMRRLISFALIALVVFLGARYVLQRFGPTEDFRIGRMEQTLGVQGQGTLEERLVTLEALAGRQRIGDDLQFRADHLASELPPLIVAAGEGLAPIEAYFGLDAEASEAPIAERLARLETLAFGAPRIRSAEGARPNSLRERRAYLIQAMRGRVAPGEAPGAQPPQGAQP